MSGTLESLRAKHGTDVGKLFERISLVPKEPLTGEDAFRKRSILAKGSILNLLLLNYDRILDSLVYGNSFIGNDYFILRYVSYELLLYWHILRGENLSEDDIETCRLEVETHFYLYLNAIYNLKEKFETLVGFRKRKIGDLVLNQSGTRKLKALFKNTYSGLRKFCEARGYVVHGTYGISVIKESATIVVHCSPYDLLPTNVYGVPKRRIEFSLVDEETIAPVALIYSLTRRVLDVLSDLDNIDAEKLAHKFIKHDKEKGALTIGF